MLKSGSDVVSELVTISLFGVEPKEIFSEPICFVSGSNDQFLIRSMIGN